MVIKSGLLLALGLGLASPVAAQTRSLVAAETMYGEAAKQIAGPAWAITSILGNPNADPHLFEASPSVARALADAAIVVSNGAGYDPWMGRLLAASPRPARHAIVVSDLLHRAPGSNPHLWYDPACMPAYATALSHELAAIDPAHAAEYQARMQAFLDTLTPVQARIAGLAARFKGVQVTATEPVFGPMTSAIGLSMRNERFQLAVMNDTEPAASDVAAMEADLTLHRVRVLIYNTQTADIAAKRLLGIAKAANIPVVGVSETEPAGQDYAGWMLAELGALEQALDTPR